MKNRSTTQQHLLIGVPRSLLINQPSPTYRTDPAGFAVTNNIPANPAQPQDKPAATATKLDILQRFVYKPQGTTELPTPPLRKPPRRLLGPDGKNMSECYFQKISLTPTMKQYEHCFTISNKPHIGKETTAKETHFTAMVQKGHFVILDLKSRGSITAVQLPFQIDSAASCNCEEGKVCYLPKGS